MAFVHSFAELRVYDLQGRVTGLVNGDIVQDIPDSFCDGDRIAILSPSDSFSFELFGTGTGSYSLYLISHMDDEQMDFEAVEIPISANEAHRYVVDWQALSQGEDSVTIQIDFNGDGVFEDVVTADNDLTEAELMLQTATVVDFDPDTLRLDAKIRWITAYIELPNGYDYDVGMIDVASLHLNDLIQAETKPIKIGDYNENGVMDLMVKFSGSSVQEILSVGKEIELTISGNLFDDRQLKGKDTIKVICPH